jgi:23S rRNA (adenine2030-N6)-methyltransferase
MQYRHVFHAGNFADVHKHIALLQLVQSLQKKAKGFTCLDTHAGEGLYDLSGADARQGDEAAAGIGQLEFAVRSGAGELHPAIAGYLQLIARLREGLGKQHIYPGSPVLTAAALRDVDQAICVESQAQVARALQRALDQCASILQTSPRVIHGNGYDAVRSQLPPPQRRGLTLIDPPYEADEEEARITRALGDALQRFETGVLALWYPIKKQHDTDLWLARITRGIDRPTLVAELNLREPDNTAGLNGSGMLVINPPWQFDTDAVQWQQQLHDLLGGTGGSAVKWRIHE